MFAARWLAVLALTILAAASLVLPSRAAAQEIPPELLRQVSGPYEFIVYAQPPEPVAGLGTRFTVHLARAQGGQPIGDAAVSLMMTKPAGEVVGPVDFLRDVNRPGYYTVLITMDDTGRWGYTINASSPAGAGSVDGLISTKTPDRAGWTGTVAWVGAVLAVALIALLAWRSLRRPSRLPRA